MRREGSAGRMSLPLARHDPGLYLEYEQVLMFGLVEDHSTCAWDRNTSSYYHFPLFHFPNERSLLSGNLVLPRDEIAALWTWQVIAGHNRVCIE